MEVTLYVQDIAGRIVSQQDLGLTRQSSLEIPVSGWAKGLYFIKLDLGEGTVYRKLFVQ